MSKKSKRSAVAPVKWYAAHLISFFEWQDPKQDRFLVWENICLIPASTVRQAWQKAENIGRAEYDFDDYSARVHGHMARQSFVGVRKVMICSPEDLEVSSGSGNEEVLEVTYSEYEVATKKEVVDLGKGKKVRLLYS